MTNPTTSTTIGPVPTDPFLNAAVSDPAVEQYMNRGAGGVATKPESFDPQAWLAQLQGGGSTQAELGLNVPWGADRTQWPDGYQGVPFREREPYGYRMNNRFGEPTETRYKTTRGVYAETDPYTMFAGMSETSIWRIQQQLEAAGFEIGNRGVWGLREAKAMTDLMSVGNMNSMTWQDVLKQVTSDGGIDGRSGGGGTLPPVEHVPEWALTTMLEEAGTEMLGRNFTDEEKSQFVAAYRELENSRDPFSPDAAMLAFAKRSDPAGYAANQASDVYGTMLRTLTGGAV